MVQLIEEMVSKIKSRIIMPELELGLDNLYIKPGELVGFESSFEDQPFLVAFTGERGLREVGISSFPSNDELELYGMKYEGEITSSTKYGLHVKGVVTALKEPFKRQSGLVSHNTPEWSRRSRYVVESAFAGNSEVIQALEDRSNRGFDLYAAWIMDCLNGRFGR